MPHPVLCIKYIHYHFLFNMFHIHVSKEYLHLRSEPTDADW
jgi:hypothetical protein